MNNYRVLIQGCNLWMDGEGQTEKYGFFTSRFVEAYTKDSAKEIALEEFIKEQKWQDVINRLRNSSNDPPQLTVEDDVDQLDSFDGIGNRYPGYALYKEDEKEWNL